MEKKKEIIKIILLAFLIIKVIQFGLFLYSTLLIWYGLFFIPLPFLSLYVLAVIGVYYKRKWGSLIACSIAVGELIIFMVNFMVNLWYNDYGMIIIMVWFLLLWFGPAIPIIIFAIKEYKQIKTDESNLISD